MPSLGEQLPLEMARVRDEVILRFLRWFPQYRALESEIAFQIGQQRFFEMQSKDVDRIAVDAQNEATVLKSENEELIRQLSESKAFAEKALDTAEEGARISAETEAALRTGNEKALRDLEAEGQAKINAQDRVRELEATVTQMQGAVAEANAKVAQSSMLVADFLSQQMFGKPIYGVAPALPEGSQTVEPINRSRVQARAAADDLTDQFMRQYEESLTQ